MTMNILAMLLSLVMMLSGGVEGQTDEAFRTLTIHDVSLTYNDQTVDLKPELIFSALTYDDKAVLEMFVKTEDDVLLPMQLGVSLEDGLTALLEKEDVAFKVSAKAFDTLSEQMSQLSGAMMGQVQTEGEDSEMLNVLTNELIPAYTGLLEAVKDPAFAEQLKADGEAAMEKIVDKGEGKPVTELIEGDNYELTEYVYTIDSAKMAEMVDTLYTSNEKLSALYDALFKFYGMLPEESGLNGVSSYADLFEKFHMNMTLEMDEKVSADGDVEIADGVLTMDMAEMVKAAAEAQGSDEPIPEMPPFVMNIHSEKLEEFTDVEVSCEYESEGTGVELNLEAEGEGANNMSMNMQMQAYQEGKPMFSMRLDARTESDEDSGEIRTDAHYIMSAPQGTRLTFNAESTEFSNGASENRFEFSGKVNDQSFDLAFNADIGADLVEDNVNGHEAVLTIDEFSQEAFAEIGENQETQGVLMRVLGSLTEDSQKLMADESVQELMALIGSMSAQPEADIYVDDSFGDAEDDDYDYDYEEPEDDGELPFNVPEFTWLPEGWSIVENDVDTKYDMVQITLTDADKQHYSYVSLFADTDERNTTNYIVADDGTVAPVEGREVIVTSYGDDDIGVTLRQSGVYAMLNFYCPELDMDTVGKIIAGMKF